MKKLYSPPKRLVKPRDIPRIKIYPITKRDRLQATLKEIKRKLIKTTMLAVMALIIAMIVNAGIDSFFEAHYLSFQSPIKIETQSPVLIHDRQSQMISPIVEQVKAEEVATPTPTIVPTVTPVSKITEALHISKRGRDCVNNNVGVAGKLKVAFGEQWQLSAELFCRESSLNPEAINPSSGACGLVQALPCAKLLKVCPDMNVDCQIQWGKDYIVDRYGTVANALKFHNKHNWY